MSGVIARARTPDPRALQRLLDVPPPPRVRDRGTSRLLRRDLLLDRADGDLARRGIAVRLSLGSDDRRVLAVAIAPHPDALLGDLPWIESPVHAADLRDALREATAARRALAAVTDPDDLIAWASVEHDLQQRTLEGPWWSRGAFVVETDVATVRRGTAVERLGFGTLRRLRGGAPSTAAMHAWFRNVPLAATPLAPIDEVLRLARSLGDGAVVAPEAEPAQVVAVIVAGDQVVLPTRGGRQVLPRGTGRGEAALRAMLTHTIGSPDGVITRLGGVAAAEDHPALEAWLVRVTAPTGDPAHWGDRDELLALADDPEASDPATRAILSLVRRSDLLADATRRTPRPREALARGDGDPPETALGTLAFHARVLAMARRPDVPLAERLRFAAIVGRNLDEFRAVTMPELLASRRAAAVREAVDAAATAIRGELVTAVQELLAALRAQGHAVVSWDELAPTQQAHLRDRLAREVVPLVLPRAVTLAPGHPVPVLPPLVPCLAVALAGDGSAPAHFVWLRLPPSVPRLLDAGDGRWLPTDVALRHNLDLVFPAREILDAAGFRLVRSAELDFEEAEAADLREAIGHAAARRALGPVACLEREATMSPMLRGLLSSELRFEARGEHGDARWHEETAGPLLDLGALDTLARTLPATEQFPPFVPQDPFAGHPDVVAFLRDGELLLHHPWDDFSASVVRLLVEAANDPATEAIRMTLYRIGDDSPIIDALARAARRGVQVAVVVELKARFDEERNSAGADRLLEAGVDVVYGTPGLKTHAKLLLILRREGDALHGVVHLGTGNYNPGTARFYTDLGLMTRDPAIVADAVQLFGDLLGSTVAPTGPFRRLLVAPRGLLPALRERIAREVAHARAGRPAAIRAKLNGLSDVEVVQDLEAAADAGVTVELVVRGMAVIHPRPNLRVVSIVGRFLEHARIVHFRNGGAEEWFIGSADWRPRNLRRRVEVMVPVTALAHRARLDAILAEELADPTAWVLEPDGRYRPVVPAAAFTDGAQARRTAGAA